MNKISGEFFFFLTFRRNNIFFVLYKHLLVLNKETKKMEQKSKVLISMSCGLFKEKGIKKHNVIAYESNLKYFLQKIKLKKIYFKKLNLIINTSRPRFSQEKLKYPSIKYHLKLLVKLLKKEKLTINIINNQKFGFNGCKLPNAQRKKNSRQSLQWFNLFEK